MRFFIVILIACMPLTQLFGQRYLFYLHGKILEDQGENAIDTIHGYGAYQYRDIINAFEQAGFIVMTELRQKNCNPLEYAHKIAGQVDSLIMKGVPPGNITVAGASKGAIISMHVSSYLKRRDVNFIFMSGCDDEVFDNFPDILFFGNILSIYEKSDSEGSCFKFKKKTGQDINHYKEIGLNTGLKHGYLYKAMAEWIEPSVTWAKNNYR